jgi:hypothetical protein
VSRVEWKYANANQLALGLALQSYCRREGLDAVGGVIVITLGDPSVSLQYLGPNKVNGQDLVDYVLSIAQDLQTQPLSGDRPHA